MAKRSSPTRLIQHCGRGPGTLAKSRAQLIALMTPEMKQEEPQQLARAQLLFDCWQHEISRRINQELAPCGDEFLTLLNELQNTADSFTYNEEAEHTLRFAKGSAHLSAEDRELIGEIAKEVTARSNYAVEVAALDTTARHVRWPTRALMRRIRRCSKLVLPKKISALKERPTIKKCI